MPWGDWESKVLGSCVWAFCLSIVIPHVFMHELMILKLSEPVMAYNHKTNSFTQTQLDSPKTIKT